MFIDTEASVLHAAHVPRFSPVGLFNNHILMFEPADWQSLITPIIPVKSGGTALGVS